MASQPYTYSLCFVPQRSPTCAAVRNPSSYYLPMDVSSRFGMRLRQLRRERNLTQLQMAIDFGIDRTFISDVERGRKSISLPMLEIMALGLKMSLSELLRDI
jgi:DNA-binding XRE family transcriptional regulator